MTGDGKLGQMTPLEYIYYSEHAKKNNWKKEWDWCAFLKKETLKKIGWLIKVPYKF